MRNALNVMHGREGEGGGKRKGGKGEIGRGCSVSYGYIDAVPLPLCIAMPEPFVCPDTKLLTLGNIAVCFSPALKVLL